MTEIGLHPKVSGVDQATMYWQVLRRAQAGNRQLPDGGLDP